MVNRRKPKARTKRPARVVENKPPAPSRSRSKRVFISFATVSLDQVRQGLSVKLVDQLRKSLNVTQSELETYLSISRQTYYRRRDKGKLSPAESDRVVRYGRLLERATDLLGDRSDAVAWLKTPGLALGGETPLERATTELGVEQVLDLIGRLEHGIAT